MTAGHDLTLARTQADDPLDGSGVALAKEFAEDWYLELRGKHRRGELKTGKTFAQVAKVFEEEYEAMTRGRRSPKWVQGHKDRICFHLMPYFGKMVLGEITSGAAQKYRVHRMTESEPDPAEIENAGGDGKDEQKAEPRPSKPHHP